MGTPVTVAVVRAGNRRDGVALALDLIADDLRAVIAPEVLLKPNLVSHQRQLPSTHADTLSAALDAALAAGAQHLTIAEGASDATAGFERFGYRCETWGRPVDYFDINKDESAWVPLELTSVDGAPLTARLSQTVAGSRCRVSLASAKTHVTSMLTFSLKNMLSAIHPDDRVMMHGHRPGSSGYRGWRGALVKFLKGDSLAVNVLTRTLGRARRLDQWLWNLDTPEGWRSFSKKDWSFLRSVAAMNRNLVALARATKPQVAVVDGFVAMHREGPRHGTPIKLGTIVAGTDAVAVDAVAATVMGFDPRRIGYLVGAEAAGLGTIDLGRIRIVGDPILAVRRRCVPHSNHAVQRHWDRLVSPPPRGPHFPVTPAVRAEAA